MDPELSRWLQGGPRVHNVFDYAVWVVVIAAVVIGDFCARMASRIWLRVKEVVRRD